MLHAVSGGWLVDCADNLAIPSSKPRGFEHKGKDKSFRGTRNVALHSDVCASATLRSAAVTISGAACAQSIGIKGSFTAECEILC